LILDDNEGKSMFPIKDIGLSGPNQFSRAAKVNEFYTNPDKKVIFSVNSVNKTGN
jgi:hypothetical protein